MLEQLTKALEQSQQQLAAERLAGNIVKENFAAGEITGLRIAIEIVASLEALNDGLAEGINQTGREFSEELAIIAEQRDKATHAAAMARAALALGKAQTDRAWKEHEQQFAELIRDKAAACSLLEECARTFRGRGQTAQAERIEKFLKAKI